MSLECPVSVVGICYGCRFLVHLDFSSVLLEHEIEIQVTVYEKLQTFIFANAPTSRDVSITFDFRFFVLFSTF